LEYSLDKTKKRCEQWILLPDMAMSAKRTLFILSHNEIFGFSICDFAPKVIEFFKRERLGKKKL
jgi:hypothetical protein